MARKQVFSHDRVLFRTTTPGCPAICAKAYKTLSLDIPVHVPFDALPFPWRQLTSLTIAFEFWDRDDDNIGVDILQACVNLEEFIMTGSLKTPSLQDFAVNSSYSISSHVYNYIERNGSTLLKLSITPSDRRLAESIPYFRSPVELRLYDNRYGEDGWMIMYWILSFLVVKPKMDPSTIPLPRLEALEIICQATIMNQRMFMEVIDSRWWSDEQENAKQKQGRRSPSCIKRSVLMIVQAELDMIHKDDADVLRAQGMSLSIEYLVPFDYAVWRDGFLQTPLYMND